jgi:hypothetical protein
MGNISLNAFSWKYTVECIRTDHTCKLTNFGLRILQYMIPSPTPTHILAIAYTTQYYGTSRM